MSMRMPHLSGSRRKHNSGCSMVEVWIIAIIVFLGCIGSLMGW